MKTNLRELKAIIKSVLVEQEQKFYPLKTRTNSYQFRLGANTHNIDFVEQVYVPEIGKYVNLVPHSVLEKIAQAEIDYIRNSSGYRPGREHYMKAAMMGEREIGFMGVLDLGCGFYFYTKTSLTSIQISGSRDYQEDEEIPLETEFLIFYSGKDLSNLDFGDRSVLIRPPGKLTDKKSFHDPEVAYDEANIYVDRARSVHRKHKSIKGCDFKKYYEEGKRLRDRPKKREGEMISPESPQMVYSDTPSEDTGLDLPDFVNTSPVKPYDSPFKGGLDQARNPYKED